MGRPHRRCRGLGRSERIRVPSPAARTTAESAAFGHRRILSPPGSPACVWDTPWYVPEMMPYDEFGLFHENAAEYGLPYDGPPAVRRVDVEVGPGRRCQQPAVGRPRPPSWCSSTAGPRTPTPGTPSPWPWAGRCWPWTCPATATPTAGPTAPCRSAATAATWRPSWPSWPPTPGGVVGMSLGGMSSIALAAALARARARPRPGRHHARGERGEGGAGDQLRQRARQLRQLRRAAGPHHGAQPHPVGVVAAPGHPPQRGAARRRHLGLALRALPRPSESAAQPEFGDWWEAVSALTVPAAARARAGLVGRRRRRRGRAPAPPARRCQVVGVEGAGHSIQGDRPLELAAILNDFLFPGRVTDLGRRLALAPRLRLHVVILSSSPASGVVLLAAPAGPRRQHPELGLRLRVAALRRVRHLHVVAPRPRGARGRAARRRRGRGRRSGRLRRRGSAPWPERGRGRTPSWRAYNEYLAQLAGTRQGHRAATSWPPTTATWPSSGASGSSRHGTAGPADASHAVVTLRGEGSNLQHPAPKADVLPIELPRTEAVAPLEVRHVQPVAPGVPGRGEAAPRR